ncbi:hypothetical protein [Streptacidiphilus sp. EB103A]|uniref:hypothetical protein n=1 Tax=Streptacidiphilus sp. EB103A TaxID=3156275 RepID=UPI003513F6E3
MPQILETKAMEVEFDLSDLDLNALTVTSMHDPAAKPEPATANTAWSCSCCCLPVNIP